MTEVQMHLPKLKTDEKQGLRFQFKTFHVKDTDFSIVIDRRSVPHAVLIKQGATQICSLDEDQTRAFFDAFYDTISLLRKEGGL